MRDGTRSVRRASTLVLVLIGLLASGAEAALSTQQLGPGLTPANLGNALTGAGVTISNVSYVGADSAAGAFTGGGPIIGVDNGVILSTGDIANAVGPNTDPTSDVFFDRPGDADLESLVGATTYDAAVLEFDFVPTGNEVAFEYVFGSDEYNEFVSDIYNDVFAFFVNGVNRATLPDGAFVSIHNVNLTAHPQYFVNNDGCQTPTDPGYPCPFDTGADGFTVVLPLRAPVIPNQVNHLKIAIADVNDPDVDSWVFIRDVHVPETNCTDGIDNDGDGFIDCADIDCKFDPACVTTTTSSSTSTSSTSTSTTTSLLTTTTTSSTTSSSTSSSTTTTRPTTTTTSSSTSSSTTTSHPTSTSSSSSTSSTTSSTSTSSNVPTTTTTSTTPPITCRAGGPVTASYPDFSDVTGLTLNGAAAATTTSDGTVLRIVPAAYNQSGSFFSTTPLRAADFSTSFAFRITSAGGSSDGIDPGADGLVFVIQPVSSTIGSAGGGLGYAGIAPSVGVEFDTFRNPEFSDPSSNHVGIDVNGSVVSVATVDVTPNFDDGNEWFVWIDYDGVTLEVRANETGVRPFTPLLSQTFNVPAVIGAGDAFIGFTAGTGGAYGNHDILTWAYFDHCQPAGSTTTSTSTTSSTTSSTTTSTSTSTTSTTFPCTTAADCPDDGDPCNGREGCVDGYCRSGLPRDTSTSACEGDAFAAVPSFVKNNVTLCNTRTRELGTPIDVGQAPWGVAWAPDGTRVFVTNREDASVSVIDVATRTVVKTVPVGAQPLGVAVHPSKPRAYVATYKADRVDVIDTDSLTVVDHIPVGHGPAGVAVNPAGSRLYVANYIAGTVSVVDLDANAVVATVATPALPVGLAVHPAGTKVYVACLKGRQVAVIGTVSNSLLATFGAGQHPLAVAFDGTGTRAYVTDSSDQGKVFIVDATSDQVISKMNVGSLPLGVGVSPNGSVWIADSGSQGGELAVLTADGSPSGSPITIPARPVAIGAFIGTPRGDCPIAPPQCDDANPFTNEMCQTGVGCTQTKVSGQQALGAGTAALGTIADEGGDDPIAMDVRAKLPDLQSAVEGLATGCAADSVRVVRRALKPILAELERARRKHTLGTSGAQLLDIARAARDQLKRRPCKG